MSDDAVVSAPGKAFLIGEYAVLEGSEAVVTAVDVRAYAYLPRPGVETARAPSPFVQAALDAAKQVTGAGTGGIPIVTTQGFDSGGRKFGFGSSAAVVASVLGRSHALGGDEVEDADTRRQIFADAFDAHKKAQSGKGSGADVAASCLGGTLAFRRAEAAGEAPALRALAWPAGLQLGFFDAGAPASTTAFVTKVHAAREAQPEAYAQVMAGLDGAAQAFIAAFDRPECDWTALHAAVAQHLEGLDALGQLAQAEILTPSIRQICALAQETGLAAKPSGAGGGDLVVVFAPSRAELDHFAVELRARHGLGRFDGLGVHAPGLRREARPPTCSRMPGLFKVPVNERRQRLVEIGACEADAFQALNPGALALDEADAMVENVVGVFALPMGVATNFRINGEDVLVPMCVEEASVIAAASNAAKMIRAGGGFMVDADPPWMIAQIQLVRELASACEADEARDAALAAKAEILAAADAQHPRLVARGGGAREVEARVLDAGNIAVHVLVDCRDAMGANLLNTVAEAVAPLLAARTGWTPRLRILSNLADRRASHVQVRVPFAALVGARKDDAQGQARGAEVAAQIEEASRFAELDPYRAATHNKGIMNGVDAVVLATGNDWRAMEAAAHAYAAREGRYQPLVTWRVEEGELVGRGSLPTAVGVVGGATRSHPGARWALELLSHPSATRLGQIMAAVGVASNLAALRALSTEGINRGHMALHARAVALSAGAKGPEVEILAKALISVSEIKLARAQSLLEELRQQTRNSGGDD